MVSAPELPVPVVPTRPSRLGLSAAAIAAAVDVAYVWIIAAQGESDVLRVAFVATAIAGAALAAGIGATRPSAVDRLPWLGAATGGLLSLGYLGIFSIGMPLLIAGSLAVAAWITTSSAAGPGHPGTRAISAGLCVAAAALPWAGLLVT